MNEGPHIDMLSGRKVSFLRPRPEQIDIRDIALGLSRIARFYGQTKGLPYSVSEHAVRVSEILPDDLQLVGLLHDAQEGILGDMHSLLKRIIPQYVAIENKMEAVIARKYGLPWPHPPAVKVADLTLLSTEQRDLRRFGAWRDSPYPPLKERIDPWTADDARRRFLRRFHQLYRKAA